MSFFINVANSIGGCSDVKTNLTLPGSCAGVTGLGRLALCSGSGQVVLADPCWGR